MIRSKWRDGNHVELLEGGEEYFPRVITAIGNAKSEILVETFILFEDAIGRELHAALTDAARRGVRVELTVDDYGSPNLSRQFVSQLGAAGAHFHVFDLQPRIFGLRTNMLHRLHRKLVVVDGEVAFVGGINISHDHLLEHGPHAKHDYAVRVQGPVVRDIHLHMARLLESNRGHRVRQWLRGYKPPLPTWPRPLQGSMRAMFVTRDNRFHRDDIERHYLRAFARARSEIVVANAYFFPGYRLLNTLRHAARRGVSVHLILQGNTDIPIARFAAKTLYDYLAQAGVRIYEHFERHMHCKVAVVDGEWSTVGSSNLDPASLFLNLEANLVIQDRGFAENLRGRLMKLAGNACVEVDPESLRHHSAAGQLLNVAAFEFMRQMPSIAKMLPLGIGKTSDHVGSRKGSREET